MSRIEDKREKSDCLRVLTDVCRKYVILPESCKISGVELGEERKFGGVADVWMGKHTQGNVCVKVFRQYKDADQEKFKEVGRTPLSKSVALPWIIPGAVLPSSAVEVSFASKPAPFPRGFWTRDNSSIWLGHSPDVGQHHRVHQGTTRYRQVATCGRIF